MSHLDERDIDEVMEAALEASLESMRIALFADIPNRYWGLIPIIANPVAQLKVDLARLNGDPPLPDGSIPLRLWLKSAIKLSGTEIKQVFRDKLRKLDSRQLAGQGDDVRRLAAALADWSDEAVLGMSKHPLAGPTSAGRQVADSLALMRAAIERGTLDGLVAAALAQRMDPALLELAETKGLVPRPALPQPELERLVRRGSSFVDVRAWRMALAERESAICRVELRMGGTWQPRGTGFLVGPDLVMTNQHVIGPALGSGAKSDAVRCRFDYYVGASGVVSEGMVFETAADWLVIHSPPNRAEGIRNAPGLPPAENELDFAILRLARPAGELAIGSDDPAVGGRKRSWFKLPAANAPDQVAAGSDLLILQHPSGEPLKLAFGQVLELRTRRVRYDTRTLGGSSGSPCLDANLNLMAIHHLGDPAYAEMAVFNQGVPIQLIADHCRANQIALP